MIKVLMAFVAALAGAALAVSVAALMKDTPDRDAVARKDLAHVQATLTSIQKKLDAQPAPDQERVAARVKKILACLPEIQGEINGLTPEVTGGDVYLSNTQQISSYCSPVLYGSSSPGE